MANEAKRQDVEEQFIPRNKKVLVQFWEEIKPNTLIPIDTHGKPPSEWPMPIIVNSGGKVYMVFMK